MWSTKNDQAHTTRTFATKALTECCEPRHCLSAVTFAAHEIEADFTSGEYLHDVQTADLDGDGDVDVLSASNGKIAWYENIDGAGSFGPSQAIAIETNNRARSVFADDLDGDGDLDVLSFGRREIAWYENTDGHGSFGSQQVITTENWWSGYAADLDGDGDLDVLSTGYPEGEGGDLAWYENIDGAANFGPRQIIDTAVNGVFWSVYAADLDDDGDLDIICSSNRGGAAENVVSWYENTDGQGHFVLYQEIAWDEHAHSLDAADLDGDGDLDLLAGLLGDIETVAWFENTDGSGYFGRRHVITTEVDFATTGMSVHAADLDGDGDVDVLSASYFDRKIAWYENTDGAGRFGPQRVIATCPGQSVSAADLDGDGDLDVISGASSEKNPRSPGTRICCPIRAMPTATAGSIPATWCRSSNAASTKTASKTTPPGRDGDWNGDCGLRQQ